MRCGRVDTVAFSLTLRHQGADFTLGHPGAALGFGCAGGDLTLRYPGATLGFGCDVVDLTLVYPGAALGFECAHLAVHRQVSGLVLRVSGEQRVVGGRSEGGQIGGKILRMYRLDRDQRGDREGVDDVVIYIYI